MNEKESIYLVHFKLDDKAYSVKAHDLDMSMPTFISLKDLIFDPPKQGGIVIPQREETINRFKDTEVLMISIYAVQSIEKLKPGVIEKSVDEGNIVSMTS